MTLKAGMRAQMQGVFIGVAKNVKVIVTLYSKRMVPQMTELGAGRSAATR